MSIGCECSGGGSNMMSNKERKRPQKRRSGREIRVEGSREGS